MTDTIDGIGALVVIIVCFLALLYACLGIVLAVEAGLRFHRAGRRRLVDWEERRESELDLAVIRWAVVHGHHYGASPVLDVLVRDAKRRERRRHPNRIIEADPVALAERGRWRPETWPQFVARVLRGGHRGDAHGIVSAGHRAGKTDAMRRALAQHRTYRYAPPGS